MIHTTHLPTNTYLSSNSHFHLPA